MTPQEMHALARTLEEAAGKLGGVDPSGDLTEEEFEAYEALRDRAQELADALDEIIDG